MEKNGVPSTRKAHANNNHESQNELVKPSDVYDTCTTTIVEKLYKRRLTPELTLLVITLLSATFLAWVPSLWPPVVRQDTRTENHKSCIGEERVYGKAAVVSDSAICSKLGRDILEEKNGSIADAAIATLLCLGLATPHGTGIGGNFFATIYERESRKTYTLDARYTAPRKSHRDMFENNTDASFIGGLSVLPPSEVAGYKALHDRFGKLPWKTLFEPAIRYCHEGFPMSINLHERMAYRTAQAMKSEDLKSLFTNNITGEIHPIGHKIKFPKLARTLTTIAEHPDDFYTGTLADDIVQDIREIGGILSHEDLSDYAVKWREPARVTLKNGDTIHTAPPPAGGALFANVMKVLDGYNFTEGAFEGDPVLTYHRMVETWKFAFAKRARLADPEFHDQNEVLHELLSNEHTAKTRNAIDDDKTYEPSHYGESYGGADSGTAHVNIVAPNGDALAVTASVNTYFGSLHFGKRTGILFNSGMDDFALPQQANSYGLPPAEANFIEPGKRPLSSISPTLITDEAGNLKMMIGGSGGSYITTGTSFRIYVICTEDDIKQSTKYDTLLKVTSQILFFKQGLKKAVDAPRVHHQWIPNLFAHEGFLNEVEREGLRKKGHTMEHLEVDVDYVGSNVQCVLIKDGQIHAYADKRKGGCPSGF